MKKLKRRIKKDERVPVAEGRSCGECVACCVAPALEPLRKPEGVPCANLLGAVRSPVEGGIGCTGAGCSIYTRRPSICRGFGCGWLLGMGDAEQHRPDRCGVLVLNFKRMRHSGVRMLTVNELWPGAVDVGEGAALLEGADVVAIIQSWNPKRTRIMRPLNEAGEVVVRMFADRHGGRWA